MIYALKEKWAIEPILKMILKKKELFKIPEKKLRNYLEKAVNNNTSIIIVDEKGREIYGFLFAEIQEIDSKDVCFIHACVIEPERKQTGFDIIFKLMHWCKNKGLEDIFLLSNVHLDGFQRKYGFEPYAQMMSMNIEKVEKKRDMIRKHRS